MNIFYSKLYKKVFPEIHFIILAPRKRLYPCPRFYRCKLPTHPSKLPSLSTVSCPSSVPCHRASDVSKMFVISSYRINRTVFTPVIPLTFQPALTSAFLPDNIQKLVKLLLNSIFHRSWQKCAG